MSPQNCFKGLNSDHGPVFMNNNSASPLRPAALVALSLLAWPYCEWPAKANPTGGTVVQGAATFSSAGSQMTINTTASSTAINWQSFNIGAGETTTFVEPSSSSVVWNNIGGGSPSQILGAINANGYVVLQNQNGFAVGGSAVISTHGLIMTTTAGPAPDLSSGGAWSFNAPPPTAQIINYGQINIAGGGSAFLIASDIENNGTISAPGGKVGLYAGEQVLVSMSPDGRSLSAQVTLPQGSVDNEGNLIADGGMIAAQAQTVNQNGLVQADSVQNVNGVIELVAGDSLTFGASSDIEAQGDNTAANTSASSGGSVSLQSGNTFADQSGSVINVSGSAQGGPGGQVTISAPAMGSLNSTLSGQANTGYAGGSLAIDTSDILLNSDGRAAPDGLALNASFLPAGFSQISLTASGNLELSAFWNLPNASATSSLNLAAGNNITLDDGSGVAAGKNWNVSLTAGTAQTAGSPVVSGNDGIYLNGNAYISSQNGGINLWAANEVQIATASGEADNTSVDENGIRTLSGGNISVTTEYGDVNAGGNSHGFVFNQTIDKKAPYYSVSPSLGGISTAAGGNVTISAGGNVISYNPSQSNTEDGGTGAFGPEPGNVTITAGGNVFGHYVLANGVGTINAGNSAGSVNGNDFALSLVKGTWNVNAPNGNIYLQEVRNPNGTFNTYAYGGSHLFDYDPLAAVNLTAGGGVYLTDANLPRPDGDQVPVIYPPTLNITAGAGGVTLELGDNPAASVILFPSAYGNLTITTTDGGSLVGIPNADGQIPELLMSDSSQKQWVNGGITVDGNNVDVFSDDDHSLTLTPNLNPSPVSLNISGNMEDLTLITTKETDITVGGDMTGCGFSGQNLRASDVTSITVGGEIYNQSPYTFLYLNEAIPSLPATDLLPGMANAWNDIFTLALNTGNPNVVSASSAPASVQTALNTTAGENLVALTVPAGTTPAQLASYAIQNSALFPVSLVNGQLVGANPGFVYNAATGRLGFVGPMPQSVESALNTATITVLRLGANGLPVTTTVKNADGTTTTYFATDQISWVPDEQDTITALFNASANAPSPNGGELGYRIGGPGEFDVTAGSIDLGNTYGILSCGVEDPQGGFNRYNDLAPVTPSGASVNVTVGGDLTMLTSTIAAIGGGNVTVYAGDSMDLGSEELLNTVRQVGFGIFTSGSGNVSVTAVNDVDIDGSRIAAFNGGNISVASLEGDVNVGSGGATYNGVGVSYVDPVTGQAEFYAEDVFGSGIVANTLVNPSAVPGSASQPGNISVNTPHGNITASLGGITQEALNGNVGPGPTVTLNAGTPGIPGTATQGNIDLGDSGVIGGSVSVTASGNITGLIVSRQGTTITAAQNVSVTVLAGGAADVSGGGSVVGTIVGIGGASVSGGSVTADVLGQNVSVNGGAAQSTLGTSASATAASQSAANQSDAQARQQLASNSSDSDDDQKKKKKQTLRQRTKRVTVILPDKT